MHGGGWWSILHSRVQNSGRKYSGKEAYVKDAVFSQNASKIIHTASGLFALFSLLTISTPVPSSPPRLLSPSTERCYICTVSHAPSHTYTNQENRKYTPDQHQSQWPGILPVDKLLRIPQQHVHVRINALQRALVLRLAPFQANDHLSSDPAVVSRVPCVAKCM